MQHCDSVDPQTTGEEEENWEKKPLGYAHCSISSLSLQLSLNSFLMGLCFLYCADSCKLARERQKDWTIWKGYLAYPWSSHGNTGDSNFNRMSIQLQEVEEKGKMAKYNIYGSPERRWVID